MYRRDSSDRSVHVLKLKMTEADFEDLIGRLTLSRFRFQSPNDLERFKKNLKDDIRSFEAELKRPDRRQVRTAVARLYKLAKDAAANRPDAFIKLAAEISTLHPDIRTYFPSADVCEATDLPPPENMRSRNAGTIRRIDLPLGDEFLSTDVRLRNQALADLLTVLRTGGKIARSRRRPSGDFSYSIVPELWKPASEGVGRPSKVAEEWFVLCLQATYQEATGREAPREVHYDAAGSFFLFVEDCFEKVGIPTARSSAYRAINSVGNARQTSDETSLQTRPTD